MHELGAKSHVLKPKMWLGPTQVNYTVVPGARSLQGSSWQLAWKLERRHFYCNYNRPVQRTCCNGEDANEFGSETGISDLSQNMPHEKREPVRKKRLLGPARVARKTPTTQTAGESWSKRDERLLMGSSESCPL